MSLSITVAAFHLPCALQPSRTCTRPAPPPQQSRHNVMAVTGEMLNEDQEVTNKTHESTLKDLQDVHNETG